MSIKITNEIISDFNHLEITAKNNVIKLFETNSEIQEKFLSKNLFNSMLPKPKISENAEQAFNLHQVEQLEYGSSSLYLKEMRDAVAELLNDSSLLSKEKEILEKWLESTKPTQQLAWIYDYFRVRIPNMLQSILKGQNPGNSLKVRWFAPFYRPYDSELKVIVDFIIEKVKELKPNQGFVIPTGNLFHEAILMIEKDVQGQSTLFHVDPDERNISQASIPDPKLATNPAFWRTICDKKFYIDKSYPLTWTTWKQVSDQHLLQSQFRNRCFANCHWKFFRFFMLKNFDKSLDQSFLISHCLETKIKERIFQRSQSKDPNLRNLFENWLFKKIAKEALILHNPNIETLYKLTLELIDHFPTAKKLFIDSDQESIEELKGRVNQIYSGQNTNYLKAKKILHIAKQIFFQWEENKQSILSFSSKELYDFLKSWSEFEKILNQATYERINHTLEKIENNYGWLSSSLTFFNRKMNFYNELDIEAYSNDVSYFDYFILHSQFHVFLQSLHSPTEVLDWVRRLIEVSSRADPIMQTLVFRKMNEYLVMNQFEINDCEWLAVKEEIQSLLKTKNS